MAGIWQTLEAERRPVCLSAGRSALISPPIPYLRARLPLRRHVLSVVIKPLSNQACGFPSNAALVEIVDRTFGALRAKVLSRPWTIQASSIPNLDTPKVRRRGGLGLGLSHRDSRRRTGSRLLPSKVGNVKLTRERNILDLSVTLPSPLRTRSASSASPCKVITLSQVGQTDEPMSSPDLSPCRALRLGSLRALPARHRAKPHPRRPFQLLPQQ